MYSLHLAFLKGEHDEGPQSLASPQVQRSLRWLRDGRRPSFSSAAEDRAGHAQTLKPTLHGTGIYSHGPIWTPETNQDHLKHGPWSP